MARTEGRISASIWEDEDFLALPRAAQGTYFFLISQRDLTHAGVIPLRERRWIGSSSTTDTTALERDLTDLEEARFVVIDWEAGELLVRSLMRRDKVYRQPNVMLAAVDAVSPIASRRIIGALMAEVERIEQEELTDAQAASVTKMRQALSKRSAELERNRPIRSSGNPSVNPSRDPSGKGIEDLPGERGEPLRVSNDSPFPGSPGVPPPAGAAAQPPHDDALFDAPEGEQPPPNSGPLVAHWLERCKARPPQRVVGHMSKEIKNLLGEGIDPEFIKLGIDDFLTKDLSPGNLPSLVNSAMNRRPANSRASPDAANSTAPQRIPRNQQCPNHRDQRAGTCRHCRAERLGGDQ